MPVSLANNAKEIIFAGDVIGENPGQYAIKLLIDINYVLLNNQKLDYHTRAEFFTGKNGFFLGKRLLIRGRIKQAKVPVYQPVIAGRIIEDQSTQTFWGKVVYPLRKYIIQTVMVFFSGAERDLAIALILGGSGRLQKEYKKTFSRAGVLHILAVSGLHVGFVCLFIGIILFFLPFDARIKFIIILSVLLLYVAITGFRPSVCRASFMFFLFGMAIISQRNVDPVHITNIAALVFLIINPLILFDPGAQLSFAAIYGIFILYPKIEENLIKKIRTRFLKIIAASMAVSFSAQLFVAPLLIYYFHRLPIFAVFSNLIILPISSATIFLIFIILLLNIFFYTGAKFIASFISFFLQVLIHSAGFFAGFPGSTISLYIAPIFLILFYLLFYKRFRKLVIFSSIILAIIISFISIFPCIIITVHHNYIQTVLPDGKNVFIERRPVPWIIASSKIEHSDYFISRKEYGFSNQHFFTLPDSLHSKKFTFDDVSIMIAEQTTICYKKLRLLLNYESEDNKQTVYIVSNGKHTMQCRGWSSGSIFEQILIDCKLTIARFLLVFMNQDICF